LWLGSTPIALEIAARVKDEILHLGYLSDLMELMKILLMVEDGREFSLQESVDLISLHIMKRALRRSNGCQYDAARMLGMSERSLRRQIRNGIDC
jgi:transcriptional regulator with GAF, ATPase, and Fis domain